MSKKKALGVLKVLMRIYRERRTTEILSKIRLALGKVKLAVVREMDWGRERQEVGCDLGDSWGDQCRSYEWRCGQQEHVRGTIGGGALQRKLLQDLTVLFYFEGKWSMVTSSFPNQLLQASGEQTPGLEAKCAPWVCWLQSGLENWKHCSFSLILDVLQPSSQTQRKELNEWDLRRKILCLAASSVTERCTIVAHLLECDKDQDYQLMCS